MHLDGESRPLPGGWVLLNLLHRVTATIDSVIDTSDLDAALAATIADVCGALGWDAGAVHLDDRGVLIARAWWPGDDGEASKRLRRAVDDPRIFELVVASPLATNGPVAADGDTADEFAQWLAVPVGAGGERFGTLTLAGSSDVDINEQTVAALCDVGVAIGHGVARVELADQLADAEAVASRIVSRAAHDLRGVTSTIGVVATALERRMANLDADGQKQAMEILTHAAERLNALVTRLVDLSQLENGARPPYLESLPLATAVRDATDAVASETCVLDTNLDEAIAVVADRTALDEILRALLDNAVRHGASHVSVTAARRAEHVDVLVSDDGPGIAPDHVPLLFQPFSRGPDATGDGLGFSLAQSRVLARCCGGDLTLRSERPHETSFVLTLTGA